MLAIALTTAALRDFKLSLSSRTQPWLKLESALSHELFHWQSQNSAAPTTGIGQQYIKSVGEQANGWAFQLFVRVDSDSPYLACGPVQFQESHGERPMNIIWKLEVPLPASAFSQFSVLRAS